MTAADALASTILGTASKATIKTPVGGIEFDRGAIKKAKNEPIDEG